MKKEIKFRIVNLLLVAGVLMFFSIDPATAQAGQQNRKKQSFSQQDLNGDGQISQNEYKNGAFGQYDGNGDGQLSKKEYRKMNKAENRVKNGNGDAVKQQQRLKDGSGDGQQKMKNKSPGNSQGIQGKNSGTGQGANRAANPGSRRRGG